LIADYSARLAGINVGAPAHLAPSADFGLIGLAVMGQNLILNVADHGFTVCAYNRTTAKVDRFLENEAKGKFAKVESPPNQNTHHIE
jgi:6-phosphogluconate dehydrogenase